MFVATDVDADTFQDLGAMTVSYLSVVDSHPDIECINIGVPRSHEYQLHSKAFVIEQMVRDKPDTMFSRGWKLTCASQEITGDELQDSIAYCVKGKQKKEKKSSKNPTQKKARISTSIVDVDEAISKSTIEKTSTEKIRFVDPKVFGK